MNDTGQEPKEISEIANKLFDEATAYPCDFVGTIQDDFEPPFYMVPMPLDKDGHGPANEFKTVKTVYQVWDNNFLTVSEHETWVEATVEAARLNKLHQHPAEHPAVPTIPNWFFIDKGKSHQSLS